MAFIGSAVILNDESGQEGEPERAREEIDFGTGKHCSFKNFGTLLEHSLLLAVVVVPRDNGTPQLVVASPHSSLLVRSDETSIFSHFTL